MKPLNITTSRSGPFGAVPTAHRDGEWDPGRRRRSLSAIAGVAYAVIWVVGLSIWPSNLALNATAAHITESYRIHAAQAAAQYILVEGLASLLLGVVIGALLVGRRATMTSLRRSAVAGCCAVAITVSLAECVIGLMLIDAARQFHTARANDLFDAANRLDGVKLISLAAAVACLMARGRGRVLPRWLVVSGIALSVSLAVSGSAYVVLANAWAWTVYLSGPLLVGWITLLGFWLTNGAPTGIGQRVPSSPASWS